MKRCSHVRGGIWIWTMRLALSCTVIPTVVFISHTLIIQEVFYRAMTVVRTYVRRLLYLNCTPQRKTLRNNMTRLLLIHITKQSRQSLVFYGTRYNRIFKIVIKTRYLKYVPLCGHYTTVIFLCIAWQYVGAFRMQRGAFGTGAGQKESGSQDKLPTPWVASVRSFLDKLTISASLRAHQSYLTCMMVVLSWENATLLATAIGQGGIEANLKNIKRVIFNEWWWCKSCHSFYKLQEWI